MKERVLGLNTGGTAVTPLRPYQSEIGGAVLRSVRDNLGLTFSIEIARQGGKNEISAQLELLLLLLNMDRGGNIIKCSPTFKPQALTSMRRLVDKIRQAGLLKLCKVSQGHIISMGKARAIFYSAEPFSHVMGDTAHLLLEVDEAQDVEPEKFSREFRPMAASTNATTILYGTPWEDTSLLQQTKERNLELEEADGIKRHFHHDWQEVAKYNPDYQKYVQGERDRMGENHPLFLTQYKLLTVSSQSRLFSPLHLGLLQGTHCRYHAGARDKVYVAGLDMAGVVDGDGEGNGREHDAAVLTVAEVEMEGAQDDLPEAGVGRGIRVVELLCWRDEPYASLYSAILHAVKDVWNCSLVTVDSTGTGAGVASFLKEKLGRKLAPFQFTAQSKSHLGFQMLSWTGLGKIKIFAGDGSPETGELWKELEKARVSYRANQTMNFYVQPEEGHDDYLMSLALAVEAARVYRPRVARGSR